MKDKRGFTLVELVGVIVVLGMLFTIASLAYTWLNKTIKDSYYKTLSESILLGAGDYYNLTENSKPSLINDLEKVSLQKLIDENYLTNIIDRNKKQCDLERSYVAAHKISNDKIDYYVCLVCSEDNYKSNNVNCDF